MGYDDYMEYNIDGDLIDTRNSQIFELKQEIMRIKILNTEEEILRKNNVTLMDAWEKYQTLLKLIEDER